MKTKMIVAALALLMTSGVAQAAYIDAVLNTTWAKFAGSHDRCPRFQAIEEAISAELAEEGITLEMLDHDYHHMTDKYLQSYDQNPSEFCANVWQRLGPNGTYKRQMLEAK
jgi:hypothetical protein